MWQGFWQVEQLLEALLFSSRWLLAPIYVILVAVIVVLVLETAYTFLDLSGYLWTSGFADETNIIQQVFTIIDMSLVANLVLIVMLVGYLNFVSRIESERHKDWPAWIGHLDYSDLKLKVMGSIVAITSIKMLRIFAILADTMASAVNSGAPQSGHRSSLLSIGFSIPELVWTLALYLAFVVGALLVAVTNKIEKQGHGAGKGGP
jgi:uncharacterized protein (TIGR00645 family)